MKAYTGYEVLRDAFATAACDTYRAARYAVARRICSYEAAQCHRVSRMGLAFLSGATSGYVMQTVLSAAMVTSPVASLLVGTAISVCAGEVTRLGQPGVRLHEWACAVRSDYEGAKPDTKTPPAPPAP